MGVLPRKKLKKHPKKKQIYAYLVVFKHLDFFHQMVLSSGVNNTNNDRKIKDIKQNRHPFSSTKNKKLFDLRYSSLIFKHLNTHQPQNNGKKIIKKEKKEGGGG